MRNKKFIELIGREIDEHGLKVIQTLDSQLDEDKALFSFLIDCDLVEEEGARLIAELCYRHTDEFRKIGERNGK